MSVLAPLRLSEAADSLAKASTPEPFSSSRTSNWVARAGGLPDYIQHIAHDLMEKRGKTESNAIQMAIGIVKRWARGGGNVDATTRAAAAKAVAEWEAKKAGTRAKSAVQHADDPPSIADELALREAALERIAVIEEAVGPAGLLGLIGAPLREAAGGESFSPKLARTAPASNEIERFDVSHEGQQVGTISRRRGYGPGSQPDRWHAKAVNGDSVGGEFDNPLRSKDQALQAIEKHLAAAPARVINMPASGKYLVARPSSYGQTTYTEFPSEMAARHAAGLPPQPTLPERSAQVAKLGEMLDFDLGIVSGVDIPPLRRVQEARRLVPLALAEAFNADELRGFHGRWIRGGRSRRTEHLLPLRLGGQRSAAVVRALGTARDTRDKYTVIKGGKRKYTAERRAYHRRLIEDLFRESGAVAQKPGERHAVFVGGGPASGKSSAGDFMPKLDHAVEIDQDYFKNKIKEFQDLAAVHDPYASDAAHREAAQIAHQARLEAMRRGYNVVVQGTGDSAPRQFADKIVDARAQGYRPHAFYVTAPTDIAYGRAVKRAADSGRAVPEAGHRAMHANVSKRFVEVANLPPGTLESLQVFDSRDAVPGVKSAALAMHMDPKTGQMVFDDPVLAAEFLQKAHEDPGDLIRHRSFI